jgi:hypothetical protein
MVSSIAVVIFIAIIAFLQIVLRDRPFSEDFELNPIYHTPPPGVPTKIKPHEGVILTIKDIRQTMQLATILAKPDYELAKNYQKYEQILNSRTEEIAV